MPELDDLMMNPSGVRSFTKPGVATFFPALSFSEALSDPKPRETRILRKNPLKAPPIPRESASFFLSVQLGIFFVYRGLRQQLLVVLCSPLQAVPGSQNPAVILSPLKQCRSYTFSMQRASTPSSPGTPARAPRARVV